MYLHRQVKEINFGRLVRHFEDIVYDIRNIVGVMPYEYYSVLGIFFLASQENESISHFGSL
jgi:hypothetical protein